MRDVDTDRPRPSGEPLRLTVPEAAERLGVTVDAIRGRIRRKTLDSKRESGTVYVWVAASELDSRGPSAASQRPSSDQSDLIEALRDQVSYLREQLDAERQARTEERRRQDTIIAQLTQRIPELEAAREKPSESPEPRSGRSTPTDAVGEAQEPSERPDSEAPRQERSWWRRMFGG